MPTTRWEYSYRVGFGRFSDWTYSNTGAQFDPSAINPIDGLRNGVTHGFRIRAVNSNGLAGPCADVGLGAPRGCPPGAVGTHRHSPATKQITLSWTSQGSGGPSIRTWQVCGGPTPAPGTPLDCDADDDWADIRYSRSTTTTHTIETLLGTHTHLTNGVSYTFQVRARNSIGGGAPAQASPATPGRESGAPSLEPMDAGDGRVTITVDPPLENNGSPVVGYQVRKRQGDGPYDAWEPLGTTAAPPETPSAQTGAVVSGLVNGVAYTFQVRAVNAFGPGVTVTSAPIIPIGPPTVSSLSAHPGNAQVELTWALNSNGGRAISKWQYRQREANGGYGPWTNIANSGPNTTGHTVSDLSNGVTYTFQVRAVNSLGPSTQVESAAVTPAAVPPAPTVTAVRGNGQVDLSWTPGASGAPGEAHYAAPIAGWQYRIAAGDGDFGVWVDIANSSAATTGHTITGLYNGTAYTFEVRAVNANGPGPAGRAGPVTPAATPLSPYVSATRGDGMVMVSWFPSDDRGSAVTSWQVQVNGGGWTDVSADTMSLSVPTDDGTAYTIEVRGVNDVGEGLPASASLEAASVPAAPTVTAIGANGEITVSWTAGENGGSSVRAWHYRTKASIGDYGDWTEVSADTATVTLTGLDTGTGVLTYTFQVRAVNGVGEGAIATSNDATPVAASPANAAFYSGAIDSPEFCTDYSLGGAHLIAHDSNGDGTADVCALPYTRREAIARQKAVEALALEHAEAYRALVNAACAVTEGDAACGGDMLAAPPAVPTNEGGPFYSGIITGPSFCANHSLGGPTTYPHDDDKDGTADVCALPYTRREAIARQLAGDILAATYPSDFRRELASACRALTGAKFGDNPAHLATDACA